MEFFGKNVNKLDIMLLTKIMNMQNTLEQMFPQKMPNLGMKHRVIDRNLWTNDYMINVRNSLKYVDVEFDIELEESQPGLHDLEYLFTSEV